MISINTNPYFIRKKLLFFPNSLLRLSLVNNQIDSIDNDAFYNLHHLITLNLNQNKIRDINNKFNNLVNLKKINLDNNKINEIMPNTFPSEIYKIILSSNNINTIKTSTFTDLFNVTEINLNNNMISLISDTAFYNCRILQVISFKNNRRLVRITSNMFVRLPQLRTIYIDNPARFIATSLPNNASFS